MSGKSVSTEDLRLGDFKNDALFGIIDDFLCFGGFQQKERAQKALDEVTRRVEERKVKVAPNDKILAVFS
jgi:hypothetical protein